MAYMIMNENYLPIVREFIFIFLAKREDHENRVLTPDGSW